ncbi:hypothetical protein IQ250_15890, partial [Pseudanabaenaceae cyanobacterium LEGE 13415]|nr:hypothetical protein [Pseudanabaenaceae cyanobacterium LEGE 13415]
MSLDSDWQTALNPGLVQRVLRPVERPGVIQMGMATTILQRSNALQSRVPLLSHLTRHLQTAQATPPVLPIVYAEPAQTPPDSTPPVHSSSRPSKVIQAKFETKTASQSSPPRSMPSSQLIQPMSSDPPIPASIAQKHVTADARSTKLPPNKSDLSPVVQAFPGKEATTIVVPPPIASSSVYLLHPSNQSIEQRSRPHKQNIPEKTNHSQLDQSTTVNLVYSDSKPDRAANSTRSDGHAEHLELKRDRISTPLTPSSPMIAVQPSAKVLPTFNPSNLHSHSMIFAVPKVLSPPATLIQNNTSTHSNSDPSEP